MINKILKFAFLGLLLLCLIAIPTLGVYFGGFDSPSVFARDAVAKDMTFGGGSSIYMNFGTASSSLSTEENLNKTVDILSKRLDGIGLDGDEVSVSDGLIKMNVPVKSSLKNFVNVIGCIGDWKVAGSQSESLITPSMVEKISIGTDPQTQSTAFVIEMSEDNAVLFKANASNYMLSGSYVYLIVDNMSYLAMGSVPANVGTVFYLPIISGDYQTYLPIMQNDTLPSALEIEKTETIAPALRGAGLIALIIGLAIVFLALIVIAIILGKKTGVFAAVALIANVCILLTALANNTFSLSLSLLSLISMVVLTLAAEIPSLIAVKRCGKDLKDGSVINMKAIHKITLRTLLVNGLVFLATLIVMFALPSSFLTTIAVIAMLLSVGSVITYLLFVYCPIRIINKK